MGHQQDFIPTVVHNLSVMLSMKFLKSIVLSNHSQQRTIHKTIQSLKEIISRWKIELWLMENIESIRIEERQ